MYLLVNQLARALNIPKGTTRAVLTLEVGQAPTIELTMLVQDSHNQFVLEEIQGPDNTVLKRLAQVQFMIRLEPYQD